MTAWPTRVAVLMSGILLVGCSSFAATKDMLGIKRPSESWAVTVARDWVPSHAEFIRTEIGTLGDFDGQDETVLPEERRNRTVQAVFFRGNVSFPCPITPSGVPPPNCQDIDTEMRVVFDYGNGEFLYEAERPWPSEGRSTGYGSVTKSSRKALADSVSSR